MVGCSVFILLSVYSILYLVLPVCNFCGGIFWGILFIFRVARERRPHPIDPIVCVHTLHSCVRVSVAGQTLTMALKLFATHTLDSDGGVEII